MTMHYLSTRERRMDVARHLLPPPGAEAVGDCLLIINKLREELTDRRYAAAELAGTNTAVDNDRLIDLFLTHRQVASQLQDKYCKE